MVFVSWCKLGRVCVFWCVWCFFSSYLFLICRSRLSSSIDIQLAPAINYKLAYLNYGFSVTRLPKKFSALWCIHSYIRRFLRQPHGLLDLLLLAALQNYWWIRWLKCGSPSLGVNTLMLSWTILPLHSLLDLLWQVLCLWFVFRGWKLFDVMVFWVSINLVISLVLVWRVSFSFF